LSIDGSLGASGKFGNFPKLGLFVAIANDDPFGGTQQKLASLLRLKFVLGWL
jgi:hypothetical protein